MAEVALREVSKVYPGGITAVEGLNLEVADGRFVVVVGPSGCGKSTTLRMIAGLEEVSSGTIEIGGRVVNALAPKDRDVAMVFQSYALYPHLSVYDNLAFGLKLRRRELGLSKADIDRKVRASARMLGIEALLNRKPRALSGGERQRVALGRAIVRQPQAYLFDEPLSNVDARMRTAMRLELKQLHRRLGTTTVYVTHDQEEAMTLGDLIVVMKDGRAQQSGTPVEVYNRPANRFVAEFIGTPPMNFLPARVAGRDGTIELASGDGRTPLPGCRVSAADAQPGREVLLGIRPEALRPEPTDGAPGARCTACGALLHGRFCHACGAAAPRDGASASAFIDAQVELVELLGDAKDVHVKTASAERLIGRMDPRAPLREGQWLRLYLEERGLHVFEPGAMGRNLTQAPDAEPSRAN